MNCKCRNFDCFFCIAASAGFRGSLLLKELLSAPDAKEMLKKCNNACFVQAVVNAAYDLNAKNVPEYLKVFIESDALNKVDALEVFFKNDRLRRLNLSDEAAETFLEQFRAGTRLEFIDEKVNSFSKDEKDRILALPSMKCAPLPVLPLASPPDVLAPAVSPLSAMMLVASPPPPPPLLSAADDGPMRFGECVLTSTTYLVKSVEPPPQQEKQALMEEQKTQILEKMPIYLKLVIEKQLTANLYITLIRINKILQTCDEVAKRAIIIASQKVFDELDKFSINQIGHIQSCDVAFLSEIVCQILTDCHYLK